MSEPLVCCTMLTRNRPKMAARAVAAFNAQTYERKSLFVLDSGNPHLELPELPKVSEALLLQRGPIKHCMANWAAGRTIGNLRNIAVECSEKADIIAHMDDDDLSHPNRLAEQVALLTASGADCVGYHQAVFWKEPASVEDWKARASAGESQLGKAWIYTGQVPRLCAIGASLCYWRRVWERLPFDDVMVGEDSRFVARVNALGVSATHETIHIDVDLPPALGQKTGYSYHGPGTNVAKTIEPRIICSIHGSNTVQNALKPGAREWRRAAELDEYCRGAMKL